MRYSWGASVEQNRRAASATAVTVSDRIGRLSDQIAFQNRHDSQIESEVSAEKLREKELINDTSHYRRYWFCDCSSQLDLCPGANDLYRRLSFRRARPEGYRHDRGARRQRRRDEHPGGRLPRSEAGANARACLRRARD